MGLELESGRHQDRTERSKQTSTESLQGENSSPETQTGSQTTRGLYPSTGMQAPMGIGFPANNSQTLAPSSTNSEKSEAAALQDSSQQNSSQHPAESPLQTVGRSSQHPGAFRREAQQHSRSSENGSSSQRNSVTPQDNPGNSSIQQQPSQTPSDNSNNPASQNNPTSTVEPPQFERTSNKPIFAAADENAVENLNPSQILGKTADGKTLYETDDPNSSIEAAKQGAPVTELPNSQTEQIRQQQNTKANSAISSLPASAQGKMQRLDSIGATIQPRISAATTQAIGEIQNAQNASRNNLTSQIAQMCAQMSAKAQGIKTQITASHQKALASIKSSTAAAKQRLASEYQNNLQQLTSLEVGLEAKINAPFNKAHGDFLRVGNTVASEAITIGNQKAQEFAGQSPPKPSNAITKILGSIDRSSYERNWHAAKEKAAREVAAKYQQTVIAQASNSAQQLLSSKQQVISKTRELISKTKEALKTKLDAANQKIDSAEQQSIAEATSTLNQQLHQVDSTLNQNLASLDGVQSSGLAGINSAATTQLGAVRQRATALTSSLSQGITTAKTNITQALAQFNANLTSAQTPAPGAAQSLVKEAREFLDQKINTAVTQLETGINNGASQVTQSGQTAVGSINNAASQAISTAENTASQSNSALDELKANADNSFAQLENGHSQTLDNTVTDASNFFSQQSSNLGSKIDSVVANLNSKLAESTNQLTSGLRHGLAQERADIDKAANQAAAKVKPAWKQIVSVAIDVVITVGTTVAIAALAASGLGLPAAIGLAALIGAAGGVARLAAEDALNGQMSSWQEYVEEGAIGAGSGVLQLLGGKAVEKFASPLASKIAQKAAQIGIDTATNTLTDLGTRLANGEKLSLSTVGISLGSSLLGSAGGEALSGSFGKLAKKVQLDRVDNKLLQNSSDLVFDTIGNVTVDMANLTLLQGQSLSLSSLGESVGSSALGHVTGKKIHSHNGNNRSRSLDRTESNPQRIGNQPEINNNLTSIDRQVTSSDLASTSSSESSNPSVVNNNRELAAASENETTGARHRRTTIEDPSTANNKVDSQQDRTSQTNNLQRAENFDKYLTPQTRGKVPVYVDPTLQGNTVRVHYDVDKNGLVTGIHMRCGPDAKPHDIALHERTARTMQRYSGFSGRVMQIKARLQKWVGMHGEPPVGSRAWEARMEVDKLNRIIKHRLDMKAELGLKDNDQTALDAEIKHLEEQLARHEKTLEDMDRDPGVGYVAAEGYSELHNHYTGVPSPEKFLKTTKYQEDSQKALQDLHELFLGKIPEDPEKGKQHRFVRKYRKKELDILKQRLEKEGLIDKEGKLSTEIDPETAKTVMEDLLSSRNGMPFDSVYMFRGLLNPNPQKLKEAVVEELDAQGIKHAELQGTPFGKQDPETFARPNNSQVWFLKLQSGTKRLTPKKGGSLSKSDKKAIETLGTERNVGIDFAGAEDKEFTSAGMKRWQEYYSEIKKKADIDNATYVLRTHAGEGYSQRDEKGNFSSNSNHREIANKNVGQIVDALEQMANKGQLSKNVVVRLGHVTHADFEQLERLAKLSHEHGIIVEANPSSNLATGSVRDKNEMRQVLLKFLHHDGLRTTLNTDGGGVMGTTISEEYDKAEEAIELFKEGEIGLVDEKRKIIYHYSEDQMPRPRDRNPDYEYKAITEEQRNNFDIERLKQESDRYLDEIAPNIGSREQRQQSRSTKRTLAQSSSNDDREGLETKKSKRSQK